MATGRMFVAFQAALTADTGGGGGGGGGSVAARVNAVMAGPGRCCSPRHRMQCYSSEEG